MKLCKGCQIAQAVIGNYCLACKAKMKDNIFRAFNEGFAEEDERIRNANPHIYEQPIDWSKAKFEYIDATTEAKRTERDETTFNTDDLKKVWEAFERTQQRVWENAYNSDFGSYKGYGEPDYNAKKPWPKPAITWMFNTKSWRVEDLVTEGWVDVPVEAVENLLGRKIFNPAVVTYRHEIEECAKRLLILLIYGCPPRLEAA